MQLGVVLLGAIAAFSWAGCGSNKTGSKIKDASGLCTQGTVTDCVGIGNCQGMQICLVSGELGACVCDDRRTQIIDDAGPLDAGTRDAGSRTPMRVDAAVKTDGSVAPPRDAGVGADAQVHDAAPRVIEDCGNGVDDDGDGKIDCADEDCGTRTCVAAAPADWAGPVVLYVGSDAKTCGGPYTSEALRGGSAVSAAVAVCSSCSCSSANPGCAGYLGFGFGAQMTCSDAGCKAAINSSCVEIASSCLNALTTAYVQTELPPDASSCMPSAQTPTIADATFSDHVLGCAAGEALRRGGCGPGNLCAAPGPFSGPYCIVRSGDQACPSGPYTDKRVYFTAIDDTRDCSACACGTDCSYSWKVYDDADATCQTPLSTSSSAGTCTMVTPSSGKVRVGAAVTGTGACTASGGQATGGAAGGSPVTACCVP